MAERLPLEVKDEGSEAAIDFDVVCGVERVENPLLICKMVDAALVVVASVEMKGLIVFAAVVVRLFLIEEV